MYTYVLVMSYKLDRTPERRRAPFIHGASYILLHLTFFRDGRKNAMANRRASTTLYVHTYSYPRLPCLSYVRPFVSVRPRLSRSGGEVSGMKKLGGQTKRH